MGTVYFVGAGPGDVGLITRKGAALLKKADCLIYDRLIDPALLQEAPAGCERIYVGKEPNEQGSRQPRINRLLIEKAKKYPRVVRLKGGDPTVFGRISEELEILAREGIPFEIVPGVSSVWAAAAAAGIPLTDRRWSSSVAIVTGHEAARKRSGVCWQALARSVDTLVILMGRSVLSGIVKALMKAGRPGSTPIALVRWAATPKQEVLFSTLERIEEGLRARGDFGPPVVAIIGEVVKLSHQNRTCPVPKALENRKILVTRPSVDKRDLTHQLEALGATCVNMPTIEIRPRKLGSAKKRALLEKLPAYDWILFTSHHGVEALDRIKRLKTGWKAKICAIGPRTAQEVRRRGGSVDLLPPDYSKKGIASALKRIPVTGRRILIPRSNMGLQDDLSAQLRRRGAFVDEVVLYETLIPKIPAGRFKRALTGLDAVTFTSASTVRGFFQAARRARLPVHSLFNGARIVAIGPSTAQALEENGVKRYVIPKRKGNWTLDGLVETVVEACRTGQVYG